MGRRESYIRGEEFLSARRSANAGAPAEADGLRILIQLLNMDDLLIREGNDKLIVPPIPPLIIRLRSPTRAHRIRIGIDLPPQTTLLNGAMLRCSIRIEDIVLGGSQLNIRAIRFNG